MSVPAISVTVAICTRNRSTLLRQTLDRMTSLEIPHGTVWHLLVVDNGSRDDTRATAESFRGRLPLRVLDEPRTGLSHARNRAVSEASDEYILWTDDDVLVDSGWLSAFVSAVRRYPAAVAAGGPVDPWFAIEPNPEYLAAFEHLRSGFCGIDDGRPDGPLAATATLVGANMGFRRDALLRTPFDATLGFSGDALIGGEEADVLARLRAAGGEVVWCADMRVRHYVPAERMTLDYILRYYEGRGRVSVRLYGVPRGRRFGRVPTWVLRRLVESRTASVWGAVRGDRVGRLRALADYHRLRGVVRQSRLST